MDEKQRRSVTTREDPQPGAPVLDPARLEARQQAVRIRHVDRLLCDDYELVGDRERRVKLLLRHEGLNAQSWNTQPVCAPCAAGFFVLRANTEREGARWPTT
jgi:hypothetical protein